MRCDEALNFVLLLLLLQSLVHTGKINIHSAILDITEGTKRMHSNNIRVQHIKDNHLIIFSRLINIDD